ncbi:Spy/CpxP family protein refolding chaperone [Niveibacterium sp. 24ML]|uniref:Spy/CpxP family protein refolding chaperone n=1 Tax=Niveibacterium sp. 24ML TaxID=2985512 RepID=UPI00226E65A9|nr:Spy/CpxP family protein refolding chaperone [Niveibacterium sp. 24ML]MCX9157505.1 Spy/CpxP family protein refolding chaperone [Niveibacterium sp. 24ML]
MKSFKTRTLALIAAGVASAALALPVAAGRGGCPMDGGMGMGPMRGDPAQMEQRAAKRFDALHDALKLSAAQEPAWKAFRDSRTADMAAMMKNRPDPAALAAKPAPERMELMLERSKTHQAQMEKHLAELKTFYAQLTPEQKKTFDSHSMMMAHRGGKGGRGPGPAPAP